MNSRLYIYSPDEPEKSFAHLAWLFDSESNNNTITIPPSVGRGTIKKMQPISGFSITSWDIELLQPLQFDRMIKSGSTKKSFSLFYVFTRDYFTIAGLSKLTGNKEALKNIIFVSGATDLSFSIAPLQPIRAIEITIAGEWLAHEYSANNLPSYAFYAILLNEKQPILFTEQTSLNAYHSLLHLYNHAVTNIPNSAYARTKVHSLLSDIFVSVGKRNDPAYKKDLLAEEKIIAIERIMDDHLYKNLPSIESIARQLAVSESTLKRHFKALHGTSIYEYYLHKKMQRARQMLEEGPVTVKEVAYKLGYEKVSNFITIFKKHYHFSPGRLKKDLQH